MSLFLSAVYTESVFLFFALLAFLLAERGRFGGAGVAVGLALLARAAGVALLPALAILVWRSRDRLRAFSGLALAPVIFLPHPPLLSWDVRKPLAILHHQLDPLLA